jgi:hypothetical protein
MSGKDELRVPVGMGKYTFISPDNDYQIHVHRYNEPWLEIGPGHKAIYCLMAELDEARKRIVELEKKLGPKPVPEAPKSCACGATEERYDDDMREWRCSKCGKDSPQRQCVAMAKRDVLVPEWVRKRQAGRETEAEEYLNHVAEMLGVATAPLGHNGAAVHMMVSECLNQIPPGYRDNGLVEGLKRMAEELQDWREGAEAGFGVITARPRATLIALGDRLRELEDADGGLDNKT